MNTTLINNLLLLGVVEIIKIIVENIGTIADPEDDVISFVIVISPRSLITHVISDCQWRSGGARGGDDISVFISA